MDAECSSACRQDSHRVRMNDASGKVVAEAEESLRWMESGAAWLYIDAHLTLIKVILH